MKTFKFIFCLFLFLTISANKLSAQTDTNKVVTKKLYVITTSNGGEFIGTIITQDAREILIDTKDRGQVIIPKYQVKEMHELQAGELSSKGEYIADDVFASHYFLTTNALPIKKGENFVQWNFWGADVEFCVGKNLTVGIMSSWAVVPVIGSVKYSIPLSPKLNIGVGALIGSGAWILPRFGGALTYAGLTFGDRKSNVTLFGGYGAIFSDYDTDGRAFISLSGMTKIGKRVSLVFDSFVIPPGTSQYFSGYYSGRRDGFALLVPGIRIQGMPKLSFQFGFGGLIVDSEIINAPIPFLQVFQKF